MHQRSTRQAKVAPPVPGLARTLMANVVPPMVLIQKFPGSLVGLFVGVTTMSFADGVNPAL